MKTAGCCLTRYWKWWRWTPCATASSQSAQEKQRKSFLSFPFNPENLLRNDNISWHMTWISTRQIGAWDKKETGCLSLTFPFSFNVSLSLFPLKKLSLMSYPGTFLPYLSLFSVTSFFTFTDGKFCCYFSSFFFFLPSFFLHHKHSPGKDDLWKKTGLCDKRFRSFFGPSGSNSRVCSVYPTTVCRYSSDDSFSCQMGLLFEPSRLEKIRWGCRKSSFFGWENKCFLKGEEGTCFLPS